MNPYEVLGVRKDDPIASIKTQYRLLSRNFHPDRGGTHEKMAELAAAYAILSDPVKRQRYDETGQTKPDDLEAEARDALLGLFQQMFIQQAPGQADLETVDINDAVVRSFEQTLLQNHNTVAQAQALVNRLEERKKRIIKAPATDLLTSMIDIEVKKHLENIEAMQRAEVVILRAQEMAREFEFSPPTRNRVVMGTSATSQTGLPRGFFVD